MLNLKNKRIDNFFRPSNSQNNAVNLFKTFMYATFFWLVFLLFFPSLIISYESQLAIKFPRFVEVGVILFVLFSSLNLWAAIVMGKFGKGTPLPLDCARLLVVNGPYKYVRNPMAVAGIGQAISVGIYLGSLFTVLYALAGALIWHFFVRPSEEKDMVKRFGDSYESYRSKINNWIPTIKKLPTQ